MHLLGNFAAAQLDSLTPRKRLYYVRFVPAGRRKPADAMRFL
jgi:hypothetical protein